MHALRSERGSAIVTAIALMVIMITIGLAAFALADDQQGGGKKERERETSFNLAESLLNSQAYILSRGWRATNRVAPAAYPTQCNQTNAMGFPRDCPQPAQLAAAFDMPDYTRREVIWTTSIHDDDGTSFYDANKIEGVPGDATRPGTPLYDANRNDRVWVRAQATIRRPGAGSCTSGPTGPPVECRTRAVVALLTIDKLQETLPQRVIIAGKFTLNPNGNHPYVKTNPDTTSPHSVTLRCNPPREPSASDPCLAYDPDHKRPQIDPEGSYEQGYVNQDALGDDVKERLKERAMEDNTYFTRCPTDTELNGSVVWVSGCPEAHYTQNNVWNSPQRPGILIWEDGLLELGGQSTFWGVIYHLNNSNSSDYLLQLRGGLTIEGGVFVDGPGGIDVGSNKVNVDFWADAFTSISTYGTASVIQNSWREVLCIPQGGC
jgi:hypothetical protein